MGTGGHARVVFNALKCSGREVLGFVTPDIDKGVDFCGKKILGNDSAISQYTQDEIELANGIGSLPGKNIRCSVATKMRERGYSFTTVIHPSAIIAIDVNLNEGVQLMAGGVIQSGVAIEKDSIINTGTVIDHDCKVANNCHLAPGVVCSGGVEIGQNTHLGTGTIVTEYILIGKNSIIAAGSVVYKDIPDGTTLIQTKQCKLINQGIES